MQAPDAPPATRVFLIEDSPQLAQILAETLRAIPGVELVGTTDTELDAIEKLEAVSADLAVVDIELRRGSGLGVLAAINRDPNRYHRVKPVVLTSFTHASIRQRCAELGCPDVLDKAEQVDELVTLIEERRFLPG